MKIRWWFFLIIVMTFLSYPIFSHAGELVVSAAISLKNAFVELGALHEKAHPDTKVRFNFGASGDLARQIAGGAPVDLFASAAQKDMDDLAVQGLIISNSRIDFAKNSVVLITPNGSSIRSFQDLASPQVKRIAVGNPKTVPAGRYAYEVFNHYGLLPQIYTKLIYAENVRQVLDYVVRAEVDAGVVYATDAHIKNTEIFTAASAAPDSHKPVLYPIAIVKNTKNAKAAAAFINTVRSQEGIKILTKYGFLIP